MNLPLSPGLYIVATPIGNLGDITLRAVEVLRGVAAVACEDTRVTGKLLSHLGFRQKLIRYDDHASGKAREGLLELAAMQPVALVSDAGTPLISDPGYRLVREARMRGIPVVSIPGASAAVAALTLSGLPSDRFLFAGFLPGKVKARCDVLAELAAVQTTLIFYETAPRLLDALAAIATVLPGREVAVAREITKKFEECRTGTPAELTGHYAAHPPRGEIVLVIAPPSGKVSEVHDIDALLLAAMEKHKPSLAVAEVARISGQDRKMLYSRAMELK